ncbi:MAG TPA: galactose-1-phosphate uridylyltransferase, partial [Chloroflexi bacterium]|nr:galactose-1-phosphate uridylyltransferase [Chloroflexota bacterium]
MVGPHRHYNPLTGEWVLVSPQRIQRPWRGQVEPSPQEARPAYDPDCYLCPGNERAGGQRNPPYTDTFVFDNDFPALLPDAPPFQMDEQGLLIARRERGICRVLCFSPRHDLTLATLSSSALLRVVETWIEQYRDLGARPFI